MLLALAVDDFMLKMDLEAPGSPSHCHLFGSLPPALLAMFDSGAQAAGDPVNRHFLQSNLPLEWQAEAVCAASDAGPVYALLRAHGVDNGISVPVRCHRVASRVDFYRTRPKASPLPAVLRMNLHLLAIHLHEAAQLLWRKERPDQVSPLSECELECLQWSARGKTGKETALILGISHHTVYFHIKNAAAKFNVFSTRQAINRATMMKLL